MKNVELKLPDNIKVPYEREEFYNRFSESLILDLEKEGEISVCGFDSIGQLCGVDIALTKHFSYIRASKGLTYQEKRVNLNDKDYIKTSEISQDKNKLRLILKLKWLTKEKTEEKMMN